MAEISRFYGIIISMFGYDHNPPHIHIRYGDYEAFITIESMIIKGEIPAKVVKIVQEWMELHKDELILNWQNAINGLEIIKIDPLK